MFLRRTWRRAAAAALLLLSSLLLLVPTGCCSCRGDLPGAGIAHVASWVEARSPAPEGSRPLRVVSFNVGLLPVVDADDKAGRAAAIAPALEPLPDVVVLEEAYDADATEAVLGALAERGLVHVTQRIVGGWGLFDGGVRIASRWPIEVQDARVFPCGAFPDAFADKGVVYARLRRDGEAFHVFGTHLQSAVTAFDETHARQIQREQLRLIREFVDAQEIPAGEPLLLAGDMNYDLRTPAELGELLGLLQADLPPLDLADAPYSYDGTRNRLSRPGARRWVDYILLLRGGIAPTWARLRALPIQGPGGRDLSDHFPVEGTFVFPPVLR